MPVTGEASWEKLAEMGIEVRPLPTEWPGRRTPPHEVERSSFKTTLQATLSGLATELRQHEAEDVRLHLDIPDSRLRNDGLPYKGRAPNAPGVILSFHYPRLDERVRYPCDSYEGWKCNLRAVVLTLASLRAVDRYGVLKHGEQYRGSQYQLQAGESEPMTPEQAVLYVHDHSGRRLRRPGGATEDDRGRIAEALLARPELFKALYRAAIKLHHPDQGGSDRIVWQRLQHARAVAEGVHERKALGVGA